jgi:hypothetical protein
MYLAHGFRDFSPQSAGFVASMPMESKGSCRECVAEEAVYIMATRKQRVRKEGPGPKHSL